ncbi:MAG: hypothetical protein MK212_10470 [Saprospiraceae bacterium]|nr:hypothetical protein [Saprospiraceae bacterium]
MSTNVHQYNNSQSFYAMSWISFAIASLGTLLGLYFVELDWTVKAFFAMSYLFTVSSCFTLAKVIRDKQEGDRLHIKIEEAKTQKLINEYADPNKNL